MVTLLIAQPQQTPTSTGRSRLAGAGVSTRAGKAANGIPPVGKFQITTGTPEHFPSLIQFHQFNCSIQLDLVFPTDSIRSIRIALQVPSIDCPSSSAPEKPQVISISFPKPRVRRCLRCRSGWSVTSGELIVQKSRKLNSRHHRKSRRGLRKSSAALVLQVTPILLDTMKERTTGF